MQVFKPLRLSLKPLPSLMIIGNRDKYIAPCPPFPWIDFEFKAAEAVKADGPEQPGLSY
jgi:hypothetical protein